MIRRSDDRAELVWSVADALTYLRRVAIEADLAELITDFDGLIAKIETKAEDIDLHQLDNSGGPHGQDISRRRFRDS